MKIIKHQRRVSKAEKVRRFLKELEKDPEKTLLCDSEKDAKYIGDIMRAQGKISYRQKSPERGWFVGLRA